MKIEWREDNSDVNEETPEVKEKPKKDTLDKYNEEMARDAVSSLFDEGEATDDAPVVTGFDKPAAKPVPRVTRAARPDRDKTPGPRVQDVLSGAEEPPRRRDRTREANPTPRPAVRYSPPPKERKTVRTSPVTYDDTEDYADTDGSVEEDMNTFRKHYEPAREKERQRTAPERTRRLHYDNAELADDDEKISPLRWVLIGGAFILLCIAVYLAYRVSVLSDDLAKAQAALSDSPNLSDVTQAQLTLEEQTTQLQERDREIERLQGIIANYEANSGDSPPNFSLDNTPPEGGVSAPQVPTEGGNPPPPAEQTYVVKAGDTLYDLAVHFYGNGSQANVDKIMTANGMTSTGLSIDQVLIIPPQ